MSHRHELHGNECAFQLNFYRILSNANNNNGKKVKLIFDSSPICNSNFLFIRCILLVTSLNTISCGIYFGMVNTSARKQSKKSIFFNNKIKCHQWFQFEIQFRFQQICCCWFFALFCFHWHRFRLINAQHWKRSSVNIILYYIIFDVVNQFIFLLFIVRQV